MKTKILIALIVSLLFSLHSVFAQGNLTPSAPPGPTMVTLSQIEPRTPISSVPYTISQAGSYYLTTNLVANGNAITINANGVTLDLCGFTISSATNPATGAAILLNGAVTNIAIYNGHIMSGITNSSSGIYAGGGFVSGIYAGAYFQDSVPVNVRVKDVSVTGVLDYGILLGTSSTLVEACVVNVAGMYGILADTVSDSTALNAGYYAINAQTAVNCYGASILFDGAGIYGVLAENCYGATSGNAYGIETTIAENCFGYGGGSGLGISADTAENCYGQGVNGINAVNCAENCYGIGTVNYGIQAGNAVNCQGVCNGSGTGLSVTYIATGCYGSSSSGTGLIAFLANSCVGNTVSGTATNLTHNVNSFAY